MLNELSKVEIAPSFQNPEPTNKFSLWDYQGALFALGDGLDDEKDVREVQFAYRNKKVVVRGIPEDFRILLDGQLVCECVYDNLYNVNEELVKELVL